MASSRQIAIDDETIKLMLRRHFFREIPDSLVRLLEADGSLAEYRNNPTEETRSKLFAATLRFGRGTPGRRRNQKTRVSLDQTVEPAERHRAQVYASHLARHASRRKDVLNIRHMLGGAPLSGYDARDLVRQLGPRYFPPQWFEERGIPLGDHRSFYSGPEFGHDEPVAREDQKIRFAWNGKHLDIPNYADLNDFVAHYGVTLEFPSQLPIKVAGSSVMGQIQQTASKLADAYGWREADATQFILTGDPPLLHGIGFRPVGTLSSYHVAFEFRIEPWMSAKSVRDTFWQVQKQLCDPMRMKDEKQLDLHEHVESFLWEKYGKLFEELSEEELDNEWDEITELWNQEHNSANWQYDRKRLREAFLRVRPAIATPPCGPHRKQNRKGGS